MAFPLCAAAITVATVVNAGTAAAAGHDEALPNYPLAYMAIDAESGVCMIVGSEESGAKSATWLREDGEWKKVGEGPKLLLTSTFEYHAASETFVLLGGTLSEQHRVATDDCWLFRNGRWEEFDGEKPPARYRSEMSYDPNRERIVLFGGVGTMAFLDDTWEFDGKAWQKIDVTGPFQRYAPAMAFDRESKTTVLFGGYKAGAAYNNETWEYDGESWRQIDPQGKLPIHRFGGAMTTNPQGGVAMFSGFVADADLWEYRKGAWKQIHDGRAPVHATDGIPAKRRWAAFAYDPLEHAYVLYGEPNAERQSPAIWWKFTDGKWERLKN